MATFKRAVKHEAKLRMALAGPAGSGKAQPSDAKVLTPTGWCRMGNLRVGDRVIDPDGGTATVTGVYPQGMKRIFRVTFTDGASTECCEEHLWLTQVAWQRVAKDYSPGKVKPLSEINQTLRSHRGTHQNHFVPIMQAAEFAAVEPLPIDPYVVGVLLGDGRLHRRDGRNVIMLTTADPDLLETVNRLLPTSHQFQWRYRTDRTDRTGSRRYDHTLQPVHGGRSPNTVRMACESLGLFNKRSHETRVPTRYLFASRQDRENLLQGLLDTDGWVEGRRRSGVLFTTTSDGLAQDVRFLVQSLGGVARMRVRIPTYHHNGEMRVGRVAYILSIVLPKNVRPFRLTRKAADYQFRTVYQPMRAIRSVDYVGEKEAQCISVSSARQLYVTDDCIVTHNTYTAMTLAAALAEGRPFALVDTEHGSASKYSDLFSFDVLELDSFHPDRYVEAIHEAEAAGYDVLVIDSLSHAWSGKEGLLEQVERFTKLKYSGNTFRAWADATPIQNRFIDALAGASLHIIATLRSKVEYVVETNERGKASPRKVGLAPIQREGVEYEFDLFGELDQDNTLVIHKSRCPTLSGAVIAKPGPAVADTLRSWLQGAPPPEAPRDETPTSHSTESPQQEQSEAKAKRAPAELPAKRKSLTERARELGYEGDAWMALVYRLTGKRDPKLVTAQDKAKLGAYLEHLAAKANLFSVKSETHPPSEDGEPQDTRDIGA